MNWGTASQRPASNPIMVDMITSDANTWLMGDTWTPASRPAMGYGSLILALFISRGQATTGLCPSLHGISPCYNNLCGPNHSPRGPHIHYPLQESLRTLPITASLAKPAEGGERQVTGPGSVWSPWQQVTHYGVNFSTPKAAVFLMLLFSC